VIGNASSDLTGGERLGLDLLVSELDEFVVVLCDTAGNFVSWHPGVLAQFGYTCGEFVGKNLELLFPAADRNSSAMEREIATAAEKGRAADTRWLVKKSGERIMVDGVTIALRSPDGTLAGFGKVLRDITPLTRALESGRALSEALKQSTVMIRRPNGAIEHWTAGCERLYGWTAEEASGKIADALLETVFPAPYSEIERHLVEFGMWQGEIQQIRKDRVPVFVSAEWVLLAHDKDADPLVIATHTDITSRLRMQRDIESANERLKRMTIELERSNEELEEFARIASHDLRAPLTTSRWLIDLLRIRNSAQLDEDGRTCIKQIASGLERMSDLVDAILAHAQVGHSAIGSLEETDTQTALAAAIENLRSDIAKSRAIIRYDNLPPVAIQHLALTQLFQNLLGNAIKYRRNDVPPEIRITARPEGTSCLLAVQDNGIGIEPEWTERVFVPLQRRSEASARGSGLGLATCKKIVTRAGGQIWVESKVGSGSTFYFSLPTIARSSL
jgi:PAS domain S-box-containing protein